MKSGKLTFKLTKNTYKDAGVTLKNPDLVHFFDEGEDVTLTATLTNGKTIKVKGYVFSDLRGIYLGKAAVKKLGLPKIRRGKVQLEMTFSF